MMVAGLLGHVDTLSFYLLIPVADFLSFACSLIYSLIITQE